MRSYDSLTMAFSDAQQFLVQSVHRLSAWLQRIRSQPRWIIRAAMLAVVIVIAIPIVLLVMFALLIGVIVFAALAALNILVSRIRELLPRRDGRENVRVIRRADDR